MNTKLFLNEFKQRVIDNYTAQGLTFFENSSKCNLYQYMQFYLNRPVNSIYKTCITRYRIHSHVLNIESGRYFNIVRNERICTMCNIKAVEDEYHFILECDRYTDSICKYIKKYYYRNPSTFKLIQLLSVRNVKELNNIGKYLYIVEKKTGN